MSSNDHPVVDYKAVLADLEAKRNAIDKMIETVRQFIGLAPMQQGMDAPREPSNANAEASDQLTDDSFLAMSVPDAIRKYLRIMKRKQSVTEITRGLEHGGIQHTAQDFWKTVHAALHRVWETKGDVVQVGTDWALAEWYPGRKFEKVKSKPTRKGKAKKAANKPSAPKAPKAKAKPEAKSTDKEKVPGNETTETK